MAFTIAPLPRPGFPVSYRLVNDGSGNSHSKSDSRPTHGEFIDIVVRIENHIGEDLEWLHLALRVIESPPGVRVTGGRHDLGPLADGAIIEGCVGFCVETKGKPEPAWMEVRVESGDGRAFAVFPVETSIG